MRNLLKILGMVCCVIIITTNCYGKEIIRLSTGDWPPYISKNLKHNGVVLHIIAEAFKMVDINVEYTWLPWKRALLMAKNGQFDGSAVWGGGIDPIREDNFYYSDLILKSEWVFFHLKSYPFDWKEWDDLAGIPLGATLAYNYGDNFKRLEKEGKLDVQWVPSDEMNFRKLLAGRIKVFGIERDVGYSLLQYKFKPEEAALVTHHPQSDIPAYYHLIFSRKIKKNKQILHLFNKGLRRMRATGKENEFWSAFRRGEYRKIE